MHQLNNDLLTKINFFMKKFYVLIAMVLVTSMTFAQSFQVKSSTTKKFNHEISSAKAITDTAGISQSFLPVFAPNNQVVTYTDMSGGYVYGVNGNAFKAVSQGYEYITGSYPIGIEGVIAIYCGKTSVSGSATSKITYSIFNRPDSIPTTQVGTVSVDMLFNDCDTAFMAENVAMFPSVIPVTANFAIVASLLNISTDTIGFWSDQDGEGIGYTCFKYNTTWMTYKYGYGGLLTNISIFALIDNAYAGIGEASFQGMQMTIKQNPTINTLALDYAVENDSKVTFELMDMNGKVLLKLDEGSKNKGFVNSISADISNLASGMYLCSLNCDGKRLIKKLIVQ